MHERLPFQVNDFESYQRIYAHSVNHPEDFWNQMASYFTWRKPWEKTLDWNFHEPRVEWFLGGELNITENCLDRHLALRSNQPCIIWEPNDPNTPSKTYSYRDVYEETNRMANVLKSLGIVKGDRVCIYMPMIPELTFAVLACARIGAIHSVVFAGFSATSIADRIQDASIEYVITADGLHRGPKSISLKEIVDEAIRELAIIKRVLVVQHVGWDVDMKPERDHWYHEHKSSASIECPAEVMKSEDMLFILYTSGSTGKPKGVVHTCGGYMVYAGYTFANVFQHKENDVFWCTADIGWVTGHSYIVYGPLLNGATTLMFEGVPTYPHPGRFWEVIDKHRVSIFYTAPTAIRSLMMSGLEHVLPYSLKTLRVLGSVGEPINEEAWHWYHTHIGKENCPIVDTWWQTETGGIMISSLAGVTESIPAHAGRPLPGIQPCLVDADGKEIEGDDVEGYLCIKYPWPSILRTTYGDHERCRVNYFAAYANLYFTGDGARRDARGIYRLLGRVDDVINVSGHRFGTAEIENTINENKHVIESAVVGYPHDIKGQGIYAYVILAQTEIPDEAMRNSILETVSEQIGRIAKPDCIQFVRGLPKTRSGKIMRRILRKVAENETHALGDTTTLLDPAIVDDIVEGRLNR